MIATRQFAAPFSFFIRSLPFTRIALGWLERFIIAVDQHLIDVKLPLGHEPADSAFEQ